MLKKDSIRKCLIIAVVSLLILPVACKKEKDSGKNKLAGTEVVFISDPSYLFAAVKTVYPTLQWSKYLDKNNAKSDYSDKYSQAINLGTQIIDCLIAIQSKDFSSAEVIAKSMKNLSEKLNISAKIEDKAVELQDSIKSKADVKARKNVEEMRAMVINALEELSGQELDLMVQYGAWIASYSKLSNIVKDKYVKNGANLLSQKVEIDYFFDKLQKSKFKDKDAVKKSSDFLKFLKSEVYVQTEKGKFVGSDKPAQIVAQSSEILKLIREGK